MKRYQYSVTEHVIAPFATASSRDREELLRIFDRLVEDPFQRSATSFTDDRGRECQVRTTGRWALVFFVDHAECVVHVLSLERLR